MSSPIASSYTAGATSSTVRLVGADAKVDIRPPVVRLISEHEWLTAAHATSAAQRRIRARAAALEKRGACPTASEGLKPVAERRTANEHVFGREHELFNSVDAVEVEIERIGT